ncbi:MAG: 3-deoxy-D-manno-octulosonic acid transferase [Caldimicrobium sp.]
MVFNISQILYTLLYSIGLFFLFPREFLKRPKAQRIPWLKEKFTLLKPVEFERKTSCIWVHAVSLGEVLAIAPLVEELSKKYNIILTTITDTGREVALKRFKPSYIKVFYLPFDYPFLIKRFIRKTKAKALLLTETELWPNLILTASILIPLGLINGRLSQKSFKRYKWIKIFLKELFNRFVFFAVQEEEYGKRFKALGASSEKIKVVGNLKFDLSIPAVSFKELEVLPRPIIIAGSTHHPEEELILKIFKESVKRGTLILVPRHPERFELVEKLILSIIEEGEIYLRYSKLKATSVAMKSSKVIVLFDVMGKLSSLYRICDLAIIGGSFIPHGGQNPLEALYWKKPVIIGPHSENFPFVSELVKVGGIVQTTAENLKKVFEDLLNHPEKAKNLSEKGYTFFSKKRGALERTLKLIEDYLFPSQVS